MKPTPWAILIGVAAVLLGGVLVGLLASRVWSDDLPTLPDGPTLDEPVDPDLLSLATVEWPPYSTEALPDGGWMGETIRQALAREGRTLRTTFLPWVRAVESAKAGEHDGVFPTYGGADRAETYHLSRPIPSGPIVFYTRPGVVPVDADPASLTAHTVGVVRGYLNPPLIEGDPRWTLDAAEDDRSNLIKLIHGRVDLAVADLGMAQWLLTHDLGEHRDAIVPLTTPLSRPPVHVAIPRSHPRGEAWIRVLDRGLEALEADGTLEALRGRTTVATPL